MNIGIVCYPTLGGSGIVATELGHALAAQGHCVHFISYETPFRLVVDRKNIFFHQVEINRYDLFKYPDYALPLAVKIASVSKEYSLDILHVHYAIPHATSAYLAKQILGKDRPAVITTLHGTDITLVGKDPAYFEIVKYSMEHSDAVTCVSEDLKRETSEYFNLQKPIHVIYNFFIPKKELIGQKPLRCQFAAPGEKLLIHSSNFREVKSPLDVVRIFAKVLEKVPAKLLLLGAGEMLDDVKRLVAELNLCGKVYFLGESREVDPYMASADLLLLPSSHESFGLAALEAMAYGVPVVASRIGGLPEVVEEGVTGVLYPVGAVDDMARGAVELLSDPAYYDEVSLAAKKRAKELFSASKVIPGYLNVYRSALSYCHGHYTERDSKIGF